MVSLSVRLIMKHFNAFPTKTAQWNDPDAQQKGDNSTNKRSDLSNWAMYYNSRSIKFQTLHKLATTSDCS